MTEADHKPDSPVDARALLKDLQGRFDVFRNFSPLAIGIDDPTIPVVTITPLAGWVMCIGPPLPFEVPAARPYISAMISLSGVPFATMSWMQR